MSDVRAEVPTAARIVAAAERILLSDGSDAVSMRRVADAVGITPMAIYRHFPNREALLRTVADAGLRELSAQWARRDTDDDWASRLNGLLADFLDFALGKPHLYTFLMTENRERARRFPADFSHGESPFDIVVVVIEEGMREGLLRADDPREVTLCITAQTQGLVQLYLGGRIGLAEADFRELCQRGVWRVFDGIKA